MRYYRKIELDMVSIIYFVWSLLILAPPFQISGFVINNRDPKLSASPSPPLVASSSSPVKQENGIDTTKTEVAKMAKPAHHVPLSVSSTNRALSLVKREVNPADNDNGLSYDPSLMIMSKRSAAALNKLMLALRSFDEPASNSYENELDGSIKENRRYTKAGFRTAGSSYETFPSNALQRRGQKDRKVYYRCYFNAVSCF